MVAGRLGSKVHWVRRVWVEVVRCGRCAGRLGGYTKSVCFIKAS